MVRDVVQWRFIWHVTVMFFQRLRFFFCIVASLWGHHLCAQDKSPASQTKEPPLSFNVFVQKVIKCEPMEQKGSVDFPSSTKKFSLVFKEHWENPDRSSIGFFATACEKGSTLAWFYLAAVCHRLHAHDYKISGPLPALENMPMSFFEGAAYEAFAAGVAKAPSFLFFFMAPHLAREQLAGKKTCGIFGCPKISEFTALRINMISSLTPFIKNIIPDFSEHLWKYEVIRTEDLTRACYYTFCLYMDSYEKAKALLDFLEHTNRLFASAS